MKLVKSLLLGAPAALVAIAGAQAADLPVVKAAPVAYVKICDAYGAGFFYIPGTDTCLKVGGYVRAQYEYTPRRAELNYTIANTKATTTGGVTTFAGPTGYTAVAGSTRPGGAFLAVPVDSGAEDSLGWLARGRVDLDARTQSAWGTVRTVLGLRLQVGSGQFQGTATGLAYGATIPSQSAWAEAAYIQFAGFTAGRAGENFAFMPPFTWTGQHFWAGYPVGVKQLAYTGTFGGGFSATIALEDKADFSYQNANALVAPGIIFGDVTTGPYAFGTGNSGTLLYPNNYPNLIGNLRVDQAWGSAQIMGTVGQNRIFDAGLAVQQTYARLGWAVGAGLKLNLPMLAAGDSLWLTAADAEGMLDQLEGNSTSSNNPDSSQNLRGVYRYDQNMWTNGVSTGQTKGFSVGGLYVHYWTPTVRSVVAASYMSLKLPDFVTGADWTQGGYSNANAYELSGSVIWAPVTNFDIGLELAYRKLNQSVNCETSGRFGDTCAAFNTANRFDASVSPSALNARLRVQRTF